jgi:glutamyl-tRNA reductase
MPSLPALIHRLWCLHWPGQRPGDAPASVAAGSAVVLTTCLRQLAFGLTPRPVPAAADPGELCTGADAYRLLLEVMSGLRSAVPGETNVAGQFLRAWEAASATLPAAERHNLAPLVRALRDDTRTLRARHLQGMAGSSYGSLVRELLAPRRDARLLFVGTGELARSMLPLFRAWDVATWNHRPAPAGPLAAALPRAFACEAADAAAAWATDVVLTTPADAAHDAAWHARLGRHAPRAVVHLGTRRDAPGRHAPPTRHYTLDDVFDLAATREVQRRRQFAAALVACSELVAARLAAPLPQSCSA